MPNTVAPLGTAKVLISAALPTTFDDDGSTGFPSVAMTALAELVNLGNLGETVGEIPYNSSESRITQKFKGQINKGSVTFLLGRDDDDAGHVIAVAALASDNDYTIEIAYDDGESDWFTGKVMSFMSTSGGVEAIVQRELTIAVTQGYITATT